MDAKCTDPQWFAGGHHVGRQQQQLSSANPATDDYLGDDDDDADELSSLLLPDLRGNSDILEQKHVKELSKYLPARAEGYSWTLAFTTTTMGFSLKSLYRSLSRYEGPVLFIIKDNEQSIFGAFSSCSLKPSESFYGTGETYLFTFKKPKQSALIHSADTTNNTIVSSAISVSDLSPSTTTIRDGNSNQVLNRKSNSNNNNNNNNNNSITSSSGSGSSTGGNIISDSIQRRHHYFKRFPWTGDNLYFIKGNSDSLAFGAGDGNFGLWLDEDLYHGSTHKCKTFNNEPLAHHEDFVVCTLECWCFL